MQKVKESNYNEYFELVINQKKNWRGKIVDQMKYSRDPISSPLTNLE